MNQSLADTTMSPPLAPLAFRVGVVGHRPNRLKLADFNQLAGILNTILSIVKETVLSMHRANLSLFDVSTPVIRAISPLAEGSDRIFAEQALNLGYELCCVMPFPQFEFERDFAQGVAEEENSLLRFRGLVDKASSRFELDGCRNDEGAAYGAGGQVVLNQSDILIVVWDGERQGKRGGTEETFDKARRQGVTIVWVDAHAPHLWQVLDPNKPLPKAQSGSRMSPARTEGSELLRICVLDALELPKPKLSHASMPSNGEGTKAENPADGLKLYYAEPQPRWTIAIVWRAFRDIVADRKLPSVKVSISPFEEDVLKDWPKDQSSPLGKLVDNLRPYYAWSDKLAVVYADRYRSAFITAYLLAAIAVGMALLPIGAQLHHSPETVCIVSELVAIVLLIGLIFRGRLARWHERWIDYRLAAELVRHLRIVAPLGGGRPFPQVPAHWAIYGEPASTWMAWYVRAVARKVGLPTVIVNNAHLDACLGHLAELVGRLENDKPVSGQLRYHGTTSTSYRHLEERLHGLGMWLLVLTLVACGLHLLPSLLHAVRLPHWLPPALTFLCGFFPALGAALAGIINQGEFRRIEKRSRSMGDQLRLIHDRIASLRDQIKNPTDSPQEQFSVQSVELAQDAARLLLHEVLDWRIVFLDRPLLPPS